MFILLETEPLGTLLGAIVFVAIIFGVFSMMGGSSEKTTSQNKQQRRPSQSSNNNTSGTIVVKHLDRKTREVHTMTATPVGDKYIVNGTRKTKDGAKIVQNAKVTYSKRNANFRE